VDKQTTRIELLIDEMLKHQDYATYHQQEINRGDNKDFHEEALALRSKLRDDLRNLIIAEWNKMEAANSKEELGG